jgi:hypothetical protein
MKKIAAPPRPVKQEIRFRSIEQEIEKNISCGLLEHGVHHASRHSMNFSAI